MALVGSSIFDIGRLETLARGDSPVHRLHPGVKLSATLLFCIAVVSCPRYEVGRLLPFLLYPVALIALADLPAGYLIKKILPAAPFVILLGIANPFLDRAVLLKIGSLDIGGGWFSFASIVIRFFLTVLSVLILIACTGFDAVCATLGLMGIPRVVVVQLLFLYRYLFVLGEEASRMALARSLRSFGKRGMEMNVAVRMIGQLLLRTLDRAHRIHLAMLCRGFDGEIRLRRDFRVRYTDAVFLAAWAAVFAVLRFVDVAGWMGRVLS